MKRGNGTARIAGRLDPWQGGWAHPRVLKGNWGQEDWNTTRNSQQARVLNSQVLLPAQTLTCRVLQFGTESQRQASVFPCCSAEGCRVLSQGSLLLPISSLLEKETAKVNHPEHLLCPCYCPCPSYYTANRYIGRAYTLKLMFSESLFQLHREAGLPYQAEFSLMKKQSITKAWESVCLG